ncbi:leucine-rich repeat-containing protein 27-like [Ctenocephalides felis]|uniref:leucine-rich repeat-containing protein 27-like n=1 Tax=Ctenocephalides felis TaxID=7515 RepID=UPI000E6E3DE8|nr:leucine-rich repeat-containing protein 27-like [Ctenocephalides felis]
MSNINKINSITTENIDKDESKTKATREPRSDGYILDLCKNGLTCFPESYLDNRRLAYLYLDDNDIEILPNDIFTCLPYLIWLDIRNNKITEIPTSIKFHQSLETFLMQNNNIKRLPLELGTVVSIKNLQILPNDIEYPPLHVVSKGTKEVMDFLQNEYKMVDPEYSKYLLKLEMMQMIDQELNKPMPKSKPSTADLLTNELSNLRLCPPFDSGNKSEYLKRLKEVSFDVCPPLEVKKYVNPYKEIKKSLNSKRNDSDVHKGVVENSRLNLPLKKTPFVGRVNASGRFGKLNMLLKRLLDSLREAKYKDKHRFIDGLLELKRNIINRQKFKQEYRYRSHLSYSKYQDVQTEKPFGTYKEFSKMICRGELNMFKNYPNRKQKKLRRMFKPKIDVNAEISGLIKSLDRINLKDAELGAGRDPSEKKKKLAEEMAKISEIQKALKKLQFVNSKNV